MWLLGCRGCWGVLDRLRGGGQKPGKGQDREILPRCVWVCQAPAEPTGGTRTHAHPLDLSGPPARTQPTSPPHLAYLRWEMWAAWGPCKNMSVRVIFPVLGLLFACPFAGGALEEWFVCALCHSSRFSLFGGIPWVLVKGE